MVLKILLVLIQYFQFLLIITIFLRNINVKENEL